MSSLNDVASSAALLDRLTMFDDHDLLVSSNLAHDQTSATNIGDRLCRHNHREKKIADVKLANKHLGLKYISRISVLLFPLRLTLSMPGNSSLVWPRPPLLILS